MMEIIEKLLNITYTYYPKGVSTEDLQKYIHTKEYQRRLAACEDARNNNQNWLHFKDELTEKLRFLNVKYADYSVLGSVPSYFLSIYLDHLFSEKNITSLDILISVISPFWTYRFSVPEDGYIFTVTNDYNSIQHIIEIVKASIDIYFEGYHYLPENLHQTKVQDISSAHKEAPDLTIFDALFID